MTPKFTISIIALNNLGLTKKCLTSVIANSDDYELILTDNGSTDGVGAFFDELAKEYPNVRVVHNPTNMGYQEPNTLALEMAQGTYLVVLNNDTEVPPNWLTELEKPFGLYPATACISGPQDCSSALYPTFHGHISRKTFEYIQFSTACLKVEIFRKHGLWIPGIKFAYADDSSTCLRMRELGYTLHLVPIRVLHHVGQTSRFVPNIRRIQEENHAVCIQRFAHYLKVRTFGYPIVVKRGAAHGDVLLTTPIVRALHERSPLSPIYVETLVPMMYANHPFVTKAERRVPVLPNAHIIDLNNAYESHPDRHIVASYALRAELENVGHRTELYLHPSDEEEAAKLMPDGDWVAVHCGTSTWKSKEWPVDRWTALVANLRAMGLKVVLVGMHGPKLTVELDRQGATTIHQMAALIKRAKLFIGLDSLPFHCAEAVGTPAIGLFGITDPKYISTKMDGLLCVCSPEPSFGLRHRIKNATFADDGGQAMRGITVEMVIKAATISLLCPATS